ncbi:MAG: ATP-binding cassette domain-containing protein [Clostridiales bacterium]|nr:ATP-binding cassette domain-containing protein [Clostridiales bacterium]
MEFTSASANEREKRANELLLRVGIENDRQHHKPSRLSGGQQQRVAIAKALAIPPAICWRMNRQQIWIQAPAYRF